MLLLFVTCSNIMFLCHLQTLTRFHWNWEVWPFTPSGMIVRITCVAPFPLISLVSLIPASQSWMQSIFVIAVNRTFSLLQFLLSSFHQTWNEWALPQLCELHFWTSVSKYFSRTTFGSRLCRILVLMSFYYAHVSNFQVISILSSFASSTLAVSDSK